MTSKNKAKKNLHLLNLKYKGKEIIPFIDDKDNEKSYKWLPSKIKKIVCGNPHTNRYFSIIFVSKYSGETKRLFEINDFFYKYRSETGYLLDPEKNIEDFLLKSSSNYIIMKHKTDFINHLIKYKIKKHSGKK